MSIKLLGSLLLLLAAVCAHSSVVINGTRIIYQEADGEVLVQLRNEGEGPILIQSWIDTGDIHTKI
ncbi:fimbria/pilus periplasmic chaperone, partial [Staphylococcus aureus]|nr:fimbria/pilus periplasmic chaperone [Staphylococcus aureus]